MTVNANFDVRPYSFAQRSNHFDPRRTLEGGKATVGQHLCLGRCVSMTIDFDLVPHFATEQLVDRDVENLTFDIPECRVDRREHAATDGASQAVPVQNVLEL